MLRWINSLPRAIRQQFHGPRASTSGVCREEDTEQYKDVQEKSSIFKNHTLGLFACSSKSKGEEKSKNGPDQDKWYKNYKKDFCSFFQGDHCTLEALGWGAAVVLGIHFSKCPTQQQRQRVRQTNDRRKYCFLWQVAYALPDEDRLTRKSIVSSEKKQSKADTETKPSDDEDPLCKVMNEFEGICKKYVGIGRNIQGLHEAAKSHLTKAVSSWVDASHLGYTKAQFNLGLCYEIGRGIRMNLQKAEKYYKLAAEEGHSQALYNLALLYLKGEGCIEKNVPLAIELLQKAAANGLCQAQTHLGVYYTEEETQDLEKAVSFFKAAAEQNEPEAQYFLGVCYEEGLGVEVNECKSAELYSKAASSGHDGAMYNLGVFHELALGGLPEDKVSALIMYQKSADAGNEQAKLQLDKFIATAAVEEWKWVNPNSEDIQFSKLVSTNTKEIQEEENQNAASLKMNTSISSPSITDYIRNHLDSFSSRIPHNFLDPISLIQSKPTPIKSPSPIIDSSSKGEIITGDIELSSIVSQMTEWKPQYGSPRVTSGMHDRVSFSLGADEDDLEGLLSVETKIDDVSLELENHPPQIHHFCSYIQKNTTMPNLQCVSCN